MASEVDATQDSVILASFENRHSAEHMLASLGRGFRKKTPQGPRDGPRDPRQQGRFADAHALSRPVDPRTCAHDHPPRLVVDDRVHRHQHDAARHPKGAAHQVREHRSGTVRWDEHRVHEVLAQVGPDAALILVRCDDQETRAGPSLHERPPAQAKAGMAPSRVPRRPRSRQPARLAARRCRRALLIDTQSPAQASRARSQGIKTTL